MACCKMLSLPAQVDLLNEQAIILHIQALLDLHDLLLNGFEEEFLTFTKTLQGVGWGKNRIQEFVQIASNRSRYNYLISSGSWKRTEIRNWKRR